MNPSLSSRLQITFCNGGQNLSLEWQDNAAGNHQKVDFLDLSILMAQNQMDKYVEFGVYHKPGNSYAYLPYGSFHTRHTFKAWLKAEVVRLLTHSCDSTSWIEECKVFYNHLRARGYPAYAIRSAFSKVCWSDRPRFLYEKDAPSNKNEKFFETYRGCVFSVRNAPGVDNLKQQLDLSLQSLCNDYEGVENGIFPARAFFSISGAMPLGFYLRR